MQQLLRLKVTQTQFFCSALFAYPSQQAVL